MRGSTWPRASASSSRPGSARVVGTGLAVAIPDGYAGFVLPRSGLAARHGITIVNTPGLIDSGYRGELKVILLNTDAREPFVVEPGMRIAQLVVVEVPEVSRVEVDELPESERGARGFGSSEWSRARDAREPRDPGLGAPALARTASCSAGTRSAGKESGCCRAAASTRARR